MGSLPADDPTIPDHEDLYRGIASMQLHKGRIASVAFLRRERVGDRLVPADVSVDLSSKSTPRQTLDRLPQSVGVAKLTAGAVRGVDAISGVVRDPQPTNDAHALIRPGPDATGNRWKKATKKLANLAQWAIAPSI